MNEDELDRMCVERCLRGDTNAFAEILDRYEKPVYNAIIRLGAGREEARDVSQQVFLKVFERLDTYDPTRKFFSWLYRVAINETINAMKSHRAWEPLSENIADQHPSPEEELGTSQEERSMQKALLALDPKYRLALIVRHFLHLSYDEAAQVLSVPVKTVKSRLFTARQLLREIIEGQRHAAR
ncbi:MAG TPA: sigma-70 family RNA polymerase sigma factor [Thermoanaerobaculia bacterium]|jgi:RNA polymerase sigma-70 factor (ECF subfamily)